MWSQLGREAVQSEVCVIIPSYRSSLTLPRCLDAVTHQETARSYTIVVMHSGDEPICSELRQRFSSVHFLTTTERQLPGKGRNWAARQVQSQWLLFLDADCMVGAKWIDSMVSTAVRFDADGVGGSVANGSPWSLSAWTMHLLEFGDWLPGHETRQVAVFPSCNALYKRSSLLKSGGFPEDLFPAEDVVLNYVLTQMNRLLIFDARIRVSHIHTRSMLAVLKHNYRHGFALGRARKIYGLPGGRLTHVPAVLSVPLIVCLRSIFILVRCIPRHLAAGLLFVAIGPLTGMGLIAWSMGYCTAGREQS